MIGSDVVEVKDIVVGTATDVSNMSSTLSQTASTVLSVTSSSHEAIAHARAGIDSVAANLDRTHTFVEQTKCEMDQVFKANAQSNALVLEETRDLRHLVETFMLQPGLGSNSSSNPLQSNRPDTMVAKMAAKPSLKPGMVQVLSTAILNASTKAQLRYPFMNQAM